MTTLQHVTTAAKAPLITVDTRQPNRLFGDVIQAARRGLSATTAELTKASGIPCPSLEAIERGRATTPGGRHDLSVGLASLITRATSA